MRKLSWTTSFPDSAQLKKQGFKVFEYQEIKARVLSCRTGQSTRSGLGNPAQKILKIFQKHDRIAIIKVQTADNEDLVVIYGYLVEPAFRSGCTLLIFADQSMGKLAQKNLPPDLHWRYPWTFERLQNIMQQGRNSTEVTVPVYANGWRQFWNKLWRIEDRISAPSKTTRLDLQQNAAVNAGDGVVQVIAPAGSGKTTVLIERVKELIKRGTPAEEVLCMSFNRDAKVEIGERLIRAGVGGVIVRSFHGMSLAILKAENRLRKNIGGLDDSQLERIIGMVPAEKPMTVTEARGVISNYKLAAMIRPDEAVRQASGGSPYKKQTARIYELHEMDLAHFGLLDFDDLVAEAVALLQCDRVVRQRWQNKFKRVLVDEYQDIEPSQALLVGILAAPQDSLFCVGDEDQCIYAWRRATVQRIIELDQVYPGLERHALIHNYRCGRRITMASRKLIRHNKIRFNKPLLAGARDEGTITLASFASRSAGATVVARLIHGADPDRVTVLARTSRLLAEVQCAFVQLWQKEPTVELATIHASKGREWDRVIIYGVDEGQTPHGRSEDGEALEDERRLFYVALTRAKNQLEIISTKGVESRFLKEAGLL